MSSAKVLRVNYSEVATRATAAPTNGSTWTHVPVLDFPLPDLQQGVDTAQEANNTGTASLDYATVRRAPYSFSTHVFTGTKGDDGAGSDTDPSSCFMQKPLESYFGVAARNAWGLTASAVTVGAASGAGKTGDLVVNSTTSIAVGDGLMIGGEIRFVEKVVDATHLTLNVDLSSSPSNATVVYAGYNFKPTLGEYAKYIYMDVERDGHSWLLGPGKFTGLKLGVTAKGLLKYDWNYDGETWTSGFAPSSFVENAFTGSPVVASSGQVYFGTTATCISEGSIDFGVLHEDQPCATGTNGTDGLEIVGSMGAKASVKTFYAAGDFTAFGARTAQQFQFGWTVGSTAAAQARGSVAVWMPNAQVMVKEDSIQSQVGESVEIMARSPQKSTDAIIAANCTSAVYYTVFGGV